MADFDSEFALDSEVNEADAAAQAEAVDPELDDEERDNWSDQDGSVPLEADPVDVAEQRIEVHLPYDEDE